MVVPGGLHVNDVPVAERELLSVTADSVAPGYTAGFVGALRGECGGVKRFATVAARAGVFMEEDGLVRFLHQELSVFNVHIIKIAHWHKCGDDSNRIRDGQGVVLYNRTDMNAHDIRREYLAFQRRHDHAIIPRALLVPKDDPTTLFTGSGMQALLPYLLGETHPKGTRLADSQTCLRAEDIEEVGDNRHTTFFEMLGNWSLGDYFKAQQLPWFWSFLVDVVGLDPQRLYVTVFAGDKETGIPADEESVTIWTKLFTDKGIDAPFVEIGSEADGYAKGMRGGRIFAYDAKKNWWSRAGVPSAMPVGEPGGPDSEVFYEFTEIEHDTSWGEHCHVNCDCGRFMEIGNSVFMTYLKTEAGFEPLPKPNVDFGGGLERIAAAALDTPDVFKISLLWPIIEGLQQLTGKTYAGNETAMRVIADHLRAALFLATDGVTPSNKEQGYVMRRLMRRAIRFALDLGIENDLIGRIVPTITDLYAEDFPEVAREREVTLAVMQKEERAFRQTLKKGLKELTVILRKNDGQFSGTDIFMLQDTYGFPKELSVESIQTLEGASLSPRWEEEFAAKLEEQRERSRTATKGQFKGGLEGHSDIHKKYHTATHLMYQALRDVLGDHVVQRGSNITEERLRFDFSHDEKVGRDQLEEVERIVNQQIQKDLPVFWREYPTQQALDMGALGAFGDRYGDSVKIYQMGEGDDRYSFEICGGPHVDHTGQLAEGGKVFRIKKEEASSAGIRRIKAVLVDPT